MAAVPVPAVGVAAAATKPPAAAGVTVCPLGAATGNCEENKTNKHKKNRKCTVVINVTVEPAFSLSGHPLPVTPF